MAYQLLSKKWPTVTSQGPKRTNGHLLGLCGQKRPCPFPHWPPHGCTLPSHQPLSSDPSVGGPAGRSVGIVTARLGIPWVMLSRAARELGPLVLFLGLPGHHSIPTSP